MVRGVVLCLCIAFVVEARSPNADLVEELARINYFGNRISTDIFEDAALDLRDLVRKYNYPFEEHSVTTEDGYVLGLHRIPHGRDANNVPGQNKPAVFVMHGMLSSSADYITMGPGTALAYSLAEAGFDVWLGNARGTYFSRKHTTLDPDVRGNNTYWEFSWDEIGHKDLPAMIDYVLDFTGRPALHYIGMSQGTTVFWVMGALRPEYNQKIISMHALAPVAYLAYNNNPLFLALAPYGRQIEQLSSAIGFQELLPRSEIITRMGKRFCVDGAITQPICSAVIFFFAGGNNDQHNTQLGSAIGIQEFLPRSETITRMGKKFCVDGAITQPICSAVIFFIAGGNNDQHNTTMLPVKLGHAPAGISVRQLVHYGQSITDKQFRRYDHGLINNLRIYGGATPPNYDLSRVSAPVYLHYSAKDPLAHLNDVDRLYRELGNPAGRILVPHPTFSHVDFLFGINAKHLVYNNVIRLMWLYEN